MGTGIRAFTDRFYVPKLTLHYSFGIKFRFIKTSSVAVIYIIDYKCTKRKNYHSRF